MSQPSLLPELPPATDLVPAAPTAAASARLRRPVRNQAEILIRDLDSLLPEDHPARSIWLFLERLDLAPFYADIKAVADRPGHPATDPEVLLALWVYATIDGVGSARQLDRLCREHDAYRWLCGGVSVNYHTLADFRVARQQALDALLTEIAAVLAHQGLVTLQRVAQDGTKVRAQAGAGSFHREVTLEDCRRAAREQVAALAQQRAQPDPQVSRRQRAARERAARERLQRLEQALAELPALEAVKTRQQRRQANTKRKQVTEPRVSTTDPEARVMKQPDGGFRPALNLELATDTAHQIVVGVAVTNAGTDWGQAAPLEAQVAQRLGRHPDAYLLDGGLASFDDLTLLAGRGVTVYAPVPRPTAARQPDDKALRRGDPAVIAAWQARMQTEEAKTIYKERAATAECVNAQFHQRFGLRQFPVRGVTNGLSVALLLAIAHNLSRWASLVAAGLAS